MFFKNNIVYLLLLLVLSIKANSQELRTYYITCDPDEFAYIVENPYEDIYIDCVFEYDGVIWDDAKLRIRGDSSRSYPKKSYKVNFDADNRFYGRDKVNLNSQWTDPSFVREYLAYEMYERAGLYGSSSWHTRLYINGAYYGLYLDVEQVDEHFLQMEGMPADASIYKATMDGCFLTAWENVEELWEKKTNEATGFYDLSGLISWLDDVSDDDFFDQLSDYFESDYLSRVIAVNSLIGNQSTYYHNYYMVHDLAEDGVWYMLPWDIDRTFEYWGTHPDYFRCGNGYYDDVNVLIKRCWLDTTMQSMIFDQMNNLIDSLFTVDYYETITDTLYNLLYDAANEDTMKQFTIEEFESYIQGIPYEVTERIDDVTYRIEHSPLPFDFYEAMLTPSGVYFSWMPTTTADGQNVTYKVCIADDRYLNENPVYIDTGNELSLLYDNLDEGTHYWKVYAYNESNNSTSSINFYSVIEIPAGGFEGTVVTNPITGDTTWNLAGSPYSLPEGLIVEENAKLTIEPGAIVGIGAGKSLTVHGELEAIGSAGDSISFIPLEPGNPWGAINIFGNQSISTLSFTSISGGSEDTSGVLPDWMTGGMLQVNAGELDLSDSRVFSGEKGAVSANNSIINIERVEFSYIQLEVISIVYSEASVRDSKITHSATAGYPNDLIDFEYVEPLEIRGCYLNGVEDDVIDLDHITGGLIINNRISGAADNGINLGSGSEGVYIANNIITGCNHGITAKEEAHPVIYNNILAFNNVGCNIENTTGANTFKLINSVLWQNNTQINVTQSNEVEVKYCLVEGNTLYPGIGNLNSDPGFVDGFNGMYYPVLGSPLIDAGWGTDYPELDIVDLPRFDYPGIFNTGAGEINYVDIGIYEYYGPDSSPPSPNNQPHDYFLLTNYPNPFNSYTKIEFNLISGDWAEVYIFNILGQEVFFREFNNQQLGKISFLWNGRGNEGSIVNSGIYFCRVKQSGSEKTIKMLLLK